MSDYIGLDYGLGQTNIDPDTGIRYGVIPMHEVTQAWADSAEEHYTPTCGKCGNELPEVESIQGQEGIPEITGDDHYCITCKEIVHHDDAYGDEPDEIFLDDGEYKAVQDSQGDIMILKAPYFTMAQFCSPCAPGAGYIMNPVEGGPKTYCFGHDWFDDGRAPYPVYSVETGAVVEPEKEGDA